jgi:hypothetical protein
VATLTSTAPGRRASKIRFVFPKCRSFPAERALSRGGERRGTTLTSAAEPCNASSKHEAHMAGSNCCPDFSANAGHSAYVPVWEIAWKPVSETFSENGFHQAGCQRKETGVPSFSSVRAVSNRRRDIVQLLSEARLAKHISSLRRTACRPKSVRLHAFHAALVVDGCGTVCGNGRGWLRRSCGECR